MENKQNLLVTLADKNYIDQAKQLFSSVYWNAGWKGDYMLLAHEIPEKDLKWFRDKGILIKKCKPLSQDYIGVGEYKYPPVVLDKFYLFTPEFKKWKNIIYLDADIIVRASLDELANVEGIASPNVLDHKQHLKFYFKINLKRDKQFIKLKKMYNLNSPAFNSGVIVFSSKIIKKSSFDNLIYLFKKYHKIAKGDDPILNLFFYGKWKKLSFIYDMLPRFLIYKIKIKSRNVKGIILHFIGTRGKYKPWHPQNSFYKEWKSNLDKAELINLNNIPEGKKWTKFEINIYSFSFRILFFYWNLKSFINRARRKLNKIFIYIINTPERLAGKLGIFLKKYNFNLYIKLKKLEKCLGIKDEL